MIIQVSSLLNSAVPFITSYSSYPMTADVKMRILDGLKADPSPRGRSAKSLGLEPGAVEPQFSKELSLGYGKRHTQKSYPAELLQAPRFYSSSKSAMSGSPKLSLRRRACSSGTPSRPSSRLELFKKDPFAEALLFLSIRNDLQDSLLLLTHFEL